MKKFSRKQQYALVILAILLLSIVAVVTVPAFRFQDRLRGWLQRARLLPASLPVYVAPIAPADRTSPRLSLVAALYEAQQAGDYAEAARLNAILGQEAFQRAARAVRAWETVRDPETKLVPYAIAHGYAYWNGKDNAADLFSHLLIGSLYLEPAGESPWLETFQSEADLCGAMSCRIDLHTNKLIETDRDSQIFDTSEYAKDGLLPMVERFGPGPWLDRIRTLSDSVIDAAYVETPYGKLPSNGTEVNGEMLQVLSRLYWLTGEARYIDMAERIADAYFFEILPNNHGLPADYWDFANHRPQQEDQRFRPQAEREAETHPFRIVDHGGEIIPGLAELYFLEKALDRPKAESYRQPLQELLDLLLVTGRSPDGLWYKTVDTLTGQAIDTGLADTWGYLVNAYQTFDLAEGTPRYAAEIERAMLAASKQHAIQWEYDWQDGYADALESMLYLLPWYNKNEYSRWVDEESEVLFLKQRDDGFLEKWYLDGNFVRTALLYGFYKTQGTHITPWRTDIQLGAAYDREQQVLHVFLSAADDWQGLLKFDAPRHATIWNMPAEYPRLNQLPEWYTVDPSKSYLLITESDGNYVLSGQQLIEGIPWQISGSRGQFLRLHEGGDLAAGY
ncbi:MAG: hypothetical protein ACOYYS_13930 [Chloroflexota bacterium]